MIVNRALPTLFLTTSRCLPQARALSTLSNATKVAPHKVAPAFALTTGIPRRSFASSTSNTAAHEPIADSPPLNKYDGIAKGAFSKEIVQILRAKLDPLEVEIKPEGLIYLPEIKYRRILLNAFGPGGWAMVPLSPPVVERGFLTRTYAMYCQGRYVAESIGEQQYFEGVHSAATAVEAAKSNALVRCCKDLGVASELWDPTYIEDWKKKHAVEVLVENMKGTNREKKRFWRRKDRSPFEWPWKEVKVLAHHAPPQPTLPLDSGLDKTEIMLNARDEDISEAPAPAPAASPITSYPTKKPAAAAAPLPPPPPPAAPVEEPEAPTPTLAKGKGAKAPAKAAPAPKTAPPPPPKAEAAAEADEIVVEFDLDALVPHQFKRYQGKTWRQVISEPKGQAYVSWASKNFVGDIQLLAQAVVSSAEARGGWDQLANA